MLALAPFVPLLATATLSDWLIAGGIIAASFVAAAGLRRLVVRLTHNMGLQSHMVSVISRSLGAVIVLTATIYALRQLEVEVGPLFGALGVGGVVIGLSLQHVLGNLVGSILLHARRPIRTGDQIDTNGYSGTVVDINGRSVAIQTFDGEMVYVPNLKVLEEPLVNRTSNDFRRSIIEFQVGYDTDVRQCQRMLNRALRELDALTDCPLPEVLVIGFADSGVALEARFWHPTEELTARWVSSEVVLAIREKLAEEQITIPYPHRTLAWSEISATRGGAVEGGAVEGGAVEGGAVEGGAAVPMGPADGDDSG